MSVKAVHISNEYDLMFDEKGNVVLAPKIDLYELWYQHDGHELTKEEKIGMANTHFTKNTNAMFHKHPVLKKSYYSVYEDSFNSFYDAYDPRWLTHKPKINKDMHVFKWIETVTEDERNFLMSQAGRLLLNYYSKSKWYVPSELCSYVTGAIEVMRSLNLFTESDEFPWHKDVVSLMKNAKKLPKISMEYL